MIIIKKATIISLILSALIVPDFINAAPGKVVAVRGKVTAINADGDARLLKIKDPIYLMDTIKTSKRGRVQMMFKDKTLISLGLNSEMKLSEYAWDKSVNKGVMTNQVKEGVFRVLGGAISKAEPERFNTETPVATIGIRGSLYRGRFRNGNLKVVLQGGKGINIINKTGTIPVTRAGFGTTVTGEDKKPAPPARFSADDTMEMDQELEGTGILPEEPQEDKEKTGNGGEQKEAIQETEADSLEKAAATEDIKPEGEPLATGDPAGSDIPGDLNQGLTETVEEEFEEVVEPVITPPPAVQVTGQIMSFKGEQAGTDSAVRKGTLSGTNTQGTINGSSTLSDGSTYSLSYDIPAYNADASYTGAVTSQITRVVQVGGGPETINEKLTSSQDGGFSYVEVIDHTTTNTTPGYLYSELGFMGEPSATVPDDGIITYKGVFLGADPGSTSDPMDNKESGGAFMEVNWRSGKFLGVLFETPEGGKIGETRGGPVIFGNISGSTLSGVTMIGPPIHNTADDPGNMTPSPGVIEWVDGSVDFSQFYGKSYQGLGLTGVGTIIDIKDQSQSTGDFDIIAALLKNPNQDPLDITSPTGLSTWNGFITGIGEDMDGPDMNRRLFVNQAPGDLIITIDRDSGSVTGWINGEDIDDLGTLHLEIGPSGRSAYILDDNFAAIIGDGPAASGGVNDLKDHGNFLITALPFDPDAQGTDPGHEHMQYSEHVRWGYWEAAYIEPGTGRDYHIHNPGSYWIAGEMTPKSKIDQLTAASFTGVYNGPAQGIAIDTDSMISDLTGGRTSLTIDFSSSAANAVSGNITFDQVTLSVSSIMPVTSSGFTAGIEGASTGVNGAFFGPDADAIGGNFEGLKGSMRYIGIFGGNLQP